MTTNSPDGRAELDHSPATAQADLFAHPDARSPDRPRCGSARRLCIAVLDRCGNNWRNGKGGCGPLLHDNYCPTLPTMFQPFVITSVNNKTTRN